MKKEFIPYTESLALKELGFNEEVEFYKDLSEEIFDMRTPNDAPCILWQQAFRWFREKYQLDSSIALVANGYGFYIHKNRNYTNKGESYGIYITYEEAELACLKKLIEIVKEKQL